MAPDLFSESRSCFGRSTETKAIQHRVTDRRRRHLQKRENLSNQTPTQVPSIYCQSSTCKVKSHCGRRKEQHSINETTTCNSHPEKLNLLKRIESKLEELQNMKFALNHEMQKNEHLGHQVHDLVCRLCDRRDEEKYKSFVNDVENITNLLSSLSERISQVETAIKILPLDAEEEQLNRLCTKRKKLRNQFADAKELKIYVEKKQRNVSTLLTSHLTKHQCTKFENFVKMKTTLLEEQCQLIFKLRMGKEQVQSLRESLVDEWHADIDKLLKESEKDTVTITQRI